MKILIAMLGLGNPKPRDDDSGRIVGYQPCTYVAEGPDGPIERTLEYHQPVLFEALAADALWIAGTQDAERAHLRYLREITDVDRFIPIPKGMNDGEFWEMFEAVVQALESLRPPNPGEPAHALHLDLTHGFRVQPVFLLEAVRYLCSLHPERYELAGVHYNFFEDAKQPAPLLPVTAVMEMSAVAAEVNAFIAHGIAEPLARRLGRLQKEIGREISERARQEGRRPNRDCADHPFLRRLGPTAKALENFGDLVRLNLTPAAAKVTRDLLAATADHEEAFTGSMVPLSRALGALDRQLRPLLPADGASLWSWHVALARWAADRGLLQQALTHVNELTATRICEQVGVDPLDRDQRTAQSRRLSRYSRSNGARPEAWREILAACEKASQLRNRVNHGYLQKSDETQKKKGGYTPMNEASSVQAAVASLIDVHLALDVLPDPELLGPLEGEA